MFPKNQWHQKICTEPLPLRRTDRLKTYATTVITVVIVVAYLGIFVKSFKILRLRSISLSGNSRFGNWIFFSLIEEVNADEYLHVYRAENWEGALLLESIVQTHRSCMKGKDEEPYTAENRKISYELRTKFEIWTEIVEVESRSQVVSSAICRVYSKFDRMTPIFLALLTGHWSLEFSGMEIHQSLTSTDQHWESALHFITFTVRVAASETEMQ